MTDGERPHVNWMTLHGKTPYGCGGVKSKRVDKR